MLTTTIMLQTIRVDTLPLQMRNNNIDLTTPALPISILYIAPSMYSSKALNTYISMTTQNPCGNHNSVWDPFGVHHFFYWSMYFPKAPTLRVTSDAYIGPTYERLHRCKQIK